MDESKNARSSESVPRPLAWGVIASVVLLLLLWAVKSIYRDWTFSPDSRNYVNVARNVLAGRGLAQDTVGFGEGRFPAQVRFPQPMGVHGPLYPLAIAIVARMGVSCEAAALLIPIIAAGFVLYGAFLLMLRLHGPRAAWWTVGLLVTCHVLRHISGVAWAESPAIAFLLFSMLFARSDGERQTDGRMILAGVLGGLAFATRYPLMIVLPIGILYTALFHPRAAGLRRASGYALGFSLVAAPILARNLRLTGYLTGAVRNPSTVNWSENLLRTTEILFGRFLLGPGSMPFETFQTLSLLALGIFACWRLRDGGVRRWRSLLIDNGRYVLVLWAFGFAGYLALQRSLTHFDYLHDRLLSPALVSMLLLVAAVLGAIVPLTARRVAVIVLALVTAQSAGIVHVVAAGRDVDRRYAVRSSERLRWVKKQTAETDLIIAERGNDLAFYLDRPSLYFTVAPEMQSMTESDLRAVLDQACPRYKRVFVLFKRHNYSESEWRERFGGFVADLVAGRSVLVAERRELDDAIVYRMRCDPDRSQVPASMLEPR